MKRIVYISESLKITQSGNAIFVYNFMNNSWSISYNAINPNRDFIANIIKRDRKIK